MPSYAEALSALSGRLTQSTIAHSERVADTAARMAAVYGVDVEKARLAGVLHDWSKDESQEQLVSEARRLGVSLSEADMAVPEVLHAVVGAAQVAEAFPDLRADVVTAIARHSLGAPEMSDLDRIAYVADSVEPARRYDGVEALREAVGAAPLEELFVRSLASGIAHVVQTRRPLHASSVAVWNAALRAAEERTAGRVGSR